ncbi:hypothetical protein BD779DRAFT_1673541 [Infundibulicybe gibba]|nr:hypothetical protein BD779DRAFT_1673541 [Infundibulicybe gibba]
MAQSDQVISQQIIPSSQVSLPSSQLRAPTEEITLSQNSQFQRDFTPSDWFNFPEASGEPSDNTPNIPRPRSAPASPSRNSPSSQLRDSSIEPNVSTGLTPVITNLPDSSRRPFNVDTSSDEGGNDFVDAPTPPPNVPTPPNQENDFDDEEDITITGGVALLPPLPNSSSESGQSSHAPSPTSYSNIIPNAAPTHSSASSFYGPPASSFPIVAPRPRDPVFSPRDPSLGPRIPSHHALHHNFAPPAYFASDVFPTGYVPVGAPTPSSNDSAFMGERVYDFQQGVEASIHNPNASLPPPPASLPLDQATSHLVSKRVHPSMPGWENNHNDQKTWASSINVHISLRDNPSRIAAIISSTLNGLSDFITHPNNMLYINRDIGFSDSDVKLIRDTSQTFVNSICHQVGIKITAPEFSKTSIEHTRGTNPRPSELPSWDAVMTDAVSNVDSTSAEPSRSRKDSSSSQNKPSLATRMDVDLDDDLDSITTPAAAKRLDKGKQRQMDDGPSYGKRDRPLSLSNAEPRSDGRLFTPPPDSEPWMPRLPDPKPILKKPRTSYAAATSTPHKKKPVDSGMYDGNSIFKDDLSNGDVLDHFLKLIAAMPDADVDKLSKVARDVTYGTDKRPSTPTLSAKQRKLKGTEVTHRLSAGLRKVSFWTVFWNSGDDLKVRFSDVPTEVQIDLAKEYINLLNERKLEEPIRAIAYRPMCSIMFPSIPKFLSPQEIEDCITGTSYWSAVEFTRPPRFLPTKKPDDELANLVVEFYDTKGASFALKVVDKPVTFDFVPNVFDGAIAMINAVEFTLVRGDPSADPPIPPTPDNGEDCPHIPYCVNCTNGHLATSTSCSFYDHRNNAKWINDEYRSLRPIRARSQGRDGDKELSELSRKQRVHFDPPSLTSSRAPSPEPMPGPSYSQHSQQQNRGRSRNAPSTYRTPTLDRASEELARSRAKASTGPWTQVTRGGRRRR